MDIKEAKKRLIELEKDLAIAAIVEFSKFETENGDLKLYVTDRFRRLCRKGKVWKTNEMLSAIKNASYGYNLVSSRSRGGLDGIYLLDRGFSPENNMMKKIFGKFLDKPDPLVADISSTFETEASELLPVRLVSHHMRLLGVIAQQDEELCLVLVDYDDEK